MGRWCVIASVALGCNAIFEENPAFIDDASGTAAETAADSAGTAVGASSGEAPPLECEGADAYEPNDASDQLHTLDVVTSQDVVEISARLDGAVDEDWFKQTVDQAGATLVQPTVDVSAPEPVRVCLYVGCAQGETSVDCGGATPDTIDNGLDGCCGDDVLSFGYECVGAVDLDAYLHMRVTAADPTEACVPYELTLAFAP
jgi:hypothetical protein